MPNPNHISIKDIKLILDEIIDIEERLSSGNIVFDPVMMNEIPLRDIIFDGLSFNPNITFLAVEDLKNDFARIKRDGASSVLDFRVVAYALLFAATKYAHRDEDKGDGDKSCETPN